ncbi:Ubiquinone biosynthesis O-methyltransferase [compost metagenome]
MNTLDTKWSKVYDEGKDFRVLFPSDLGRIFELLQPDTTKRHLDIGCGTGGLTRDLFHRGYLSTGIDPSSSAIKRAKDATVYLDRGIDYICKDFEKIDLSEHSYSLITCKLVYAFFSDKKKSINKMAKLLAPNGSLVLITPLHTSEEMATPISVTREDVYGALSSSFNKIQELNFEWVTCYVCQN